MSIAAQRLHTSNLIPFIPRQIMLGAVEEKKEKRTKKRSSEALENGSVLQETLNHVEDKKEKRRKGKRSSETLENGSAAQETSHPVEEKKEKRKKRKGSSETLESDLDLTKGGKGRGILINSILTFLESNRFSKTLAEFRSEAQHEIDSGITSVLNLEDLFGKFLEPRSSVEDLCAQNTGIGGDSLKELKALGDEADLKKLLSVEEAPNGTKDKKKQKLNLDSLGEHAEKCHLEDSKDTKKRKKKDRECGEDVKPQVMTEDKKEETKSLSNSYAPLDESSSKHKDEKDKKKKKKRTSNSLSENTEQKEVEASKELIDKKSKDLKSLDSESQADFDQLNSMTKTTPTQNAFKRVKIDEVKFVDERLQDNSYWAKDGAESGYGAKAQEILGQVRGRNFRHEKTKKKRGSYRGGQIDLLSHSVKFNYSDEE